MNHLFCLSRVRQHPIHFRKLKRVLRCLCIPLFILSCGQTGDVGRVKKGISQYNAGDLNDAIETFSDVLMKEEKCAACLEYRGFAYKDIGQYDKAIRDFNAHIQLDTTRAAGYANRASVYYLKEDFTQSLQDFRKALSLDPENTALYNPISHMFFATGQEAEACLYYQKALALGDTTFDPEIVALCKDR